MSLLPEMPHLQSLTAQYNSIQKVDLSKLPNLRFLNLNHNLVKDLVKVPQHSKIQIVSTLDNPIVTNIRAEL